MGVERPSCSIRSEATESVEYGERAREPGEEELAGWEYAFKGTGFVSGKWWGGG